MPQPRRKAPVFARLAHAGRAEMVNLKNKRRSVFKSTKVSFSSNTKDEYFTTRYLERP